MNHQRDALPPQCCTHMNMGGYTCKARNLKLSEITLPRSSQDIIGKSLPSGTCCAVAGRAICAVVDLGFCHRNTAATACHAAVVVSKPHAVRGYTHINAAGLVLANHLGGGGGTALGDPPSPSQDAKNR